MAAVAALAMALGLGGSAQANLAGSTFEGNDGNTIVDTGGNTDWNNVAGRALGVDIASKSADDAFGQGTKEDGANVSIVDGSIPPNKNNLSRFYEADEQLANGDIMLYLAWERLVNIGNANLDFEINQKETPGWTKTTQGPVTIVRTAGDLLVTYDFSGQGTPTLGLNTWLTAAAGNTASQCYSANALPCWGKHVSLTGSNSEGAVNASGIVDTIGDNNVLGGPNQPGALGAGLFGEAAINLTDAGVFTPGVCTAFGKAFVKSRSSSSFTAELKDFIAPVDISISNCSSIKIVKATENAPVGDDTSFTYTTTGTGLADFSLKSGQNKLFENLNAGTYTVTEGALPAGWNLKSLSCSGGVDTSTSGAVATIKLALGENVVCTYTNHYTNSPKITTSASGTVLVGSDISDTATLSGASTNPAATGKITFSLYDNDTCSGTPVFTDEQTVAGNGDYLSKSFTTTAVGTYYWIASYSGDANNNPATGACKDAGEVTTVNPFSPSITTKATESVTVGESIKDVATLSGATADAGGNITFNLYGDDTCTGSVLFTSSVPVSGNGEYTSGSYAPATVGQYYWIASYSGDLKNKPASGKCNDAGEVSTVIQRGPSIVTQATATITVGASINDVATLSGGLAPTGDITFNLYGDDTCTGPVLFSSTVPVSGNGDYTSGSYTPTVVGSYYWIASYSGDTNNAAATGKCKDSGEVSVVNQASPGIVTNATASVTIDSAIADVATLSGGVGPTGTITFSLYDNDACSGAAIFTNVKPVSGNGDYASDPFTPEAVGNYYWIAAYSGDTNNKAVSGTCGDPNESSTVNKAPASQTTAQKLRPQDSVNVTAAAGGVPTGDVTFKLYDNASCTGSPVYSETAALSSGKAATNNLSFDVDAASAGTYKWLVTYSGDAKHLAITGSCGDENFTLAIDNGGTVSSQ